MTNIFSWLGRKQLLIVLGSLALVNSFLFYMGGGVHILQAILMFFLVIPVIAVFLGLITAIIPFSQLTYDQRILPAIMVSCAVLQLPAMILLLLMLAGIIR